MDVAVKSKTAWLQCPRCGNKTRTQLREHTVLEDFPLYCPKCRYECVITFRNGKIEKLFETDAKAQGF